MIAIGGRVTPTPRNERVSTARSCTGRRLGRGFIVQPRRWVVERTNGWINQCRHLDRHYETPRTHTKDS
jgi:transposase